MIVKHNFSPAKVLGYIWRPLLYAVAASVAALALREWLGTRVVVPFVPIGTLGGAVAIFVAFRNNASYARWWEGRTLWSNLHNSSRVFARQVVAATENAVAAGTASEADAAAFREDQVLRVAALAHATRIHCAARATGPHCARCCPRRSTPRSWRRSTSPTSCSRRSASA
jgi:putative membrane protein